jgi:phosphoribosylformylglycinamidine (FGAM) synthase PurS component
MDLLNVEEISSAISHSNFSEAEKAEAKSLLQKVSENRLPNTIIGSAVGELTKAALPK